VPNSLFGITVPEFTVSTVWPYDPDFGFTVSRNWDTKRHQISPVLEQRFVMNSAALLTFQLGFNTLNGDFTPGTDKFINVWTFWSTHKGRAVPFYFYDPRPWSGADYKPTNYRDDPAKRLISPGTGANPVPTTGRYIVTSDDDDLSVEQFALRLRKAQLHFSGYPG